MKEFPILDREKRDGLNPRRIRGQATGDREPKQAVSHGSSKGSFARGLVVDVNRVEVAGKPREGNHVMGCLANGHRPRESESLPVFLEKIGRS